MLVVRNPVAGRKSPEADEALLARCPLGWRCEVREASGPGDVARWAGGAEAEGFHLVVAMGGDGTAAEAAEGLIRAHSKIPLGLLPTGSANVLAQALGYPLELERAWQAMQSGRVTLLDAGHVVERDRYFLVAMSAGVHADMIHDSQRSLKRRIGSGAYLVALGRRLFHGRFSKVRLEIDGEERVRRTNLVALLNFADFLPATEVLAGGVRPDDGRLDLIVVRRTTVLGIVGVVLHALVRRRRARRRVEHQGAGRVRLRADPPLPVQIDGEPLGATPVTVEVHPGAVLVLRPLSDEDRARTAKT